MKPTRTYLKKNFRYWNMKKINKYSLNIWYLIVFLMGVFITWAVINFNVNKSPLLSPVVLNPITQVHAEEVFIPCEKGVEEYLQCLAIKGVITYKEADILTAIAKAESGLKERAKSKSSSASGVFQIIAGTWYSNDCIGDKYNFKDNTNCAIKIMKTSGFYPWTVYNSGVYKKYL